MNWSIYQFTLVLKSCQAAQLHNAPQPRSRCTALRGRLPAIGADKHRSQHASSKLLYRYKVIAGYFSLGSINLSIHGFAEIPFREWSLNSVYL